MSLFGSVFSKGMESTTDFPHFLICVGAALVLGFIISFSYMYKSEYTKSFVITLALLPAVVCVVIMMVNGNVGAGVAVAGAFSLVRFRSVPGTAKEIVILFLAMSVGLITGMGYIGCAVLFTIIMVLVYMLLIRVKFGAKKETKCDKTMRIVIPEDLDYTGVFDDIFSNYLSASELVNVKTFNMGSMFKLTYNIVLKDSSKEKEMIDMLRCRNGNLEISISKMLDDTEDKASL